MTESERNLYRSHNPNLNKDNREHLDEQNRVINLLNPYFDCTDLPQPRLTSFITRTSISASWQTAMVNRSTASSVSPTGYASKSNAPRNCCSAF
ncbi:MAG: hypothetical protein ACLUDF_01465 [Butyricicoccus sp.]